MKRHWVRLQLRFEDPKDVKLEMLSRRAALIPHSHLRTDVADRGDAISVAIRSGSVYCMRTVSVMCLWISAAIRSPILKVISCFRYAADAADNVSLY